MTDREKEDAELDRLLREAVSAKAEAALPARADVAKPVGLDPRPAPMMRPPEDQASNTSPLPGAADLMSVSPKPADNFSPYMMPDVNTLNPAQATKAAAISGSVLGGELGGAAAGGVRAVQALPAIARGAVTGAAGGAGATAGSGNLAPADLAKGAALGGVLGAGGAAAGKVFTGAGARDEANVLSKAGEGMKAAPYEKFFGSREGAVATIKADPELRAALGKPGETLALIDQRLPEAHDAATKILDTADATNGRVPVSDWMSKALYPAKKALTAIGGTEKNPAANAVDNMIDQFRSGIGANPAKPPSTADVRKFMSEVVGAKINPRPVSTDDTAMNRAATVVYSKLSQMVSDHADAAGPGLGDALKDLNTKQSTYLMLKDSAQQSQIAASKGPSWAGKLLDVGKRGVAASVGGAVGGAAAEAIGLPARHGIEAGSLVGATAGPQIARAASDAGAAVTRTMAGPTGQAVGRAIPAAADTAAHVLVPKIVQAVQSGDRKAALSTAATAVYGQ